MKKMAKPLPPLLLLAAVHRLLLILLPPRLLPLLLPLLLLLHQLLRLLLCLKLLPRLKHHLLLKLLRLLLRLDSDRFFARAALVAFCFVALLFFDDLFYFSLLKVKSFPIRFVRTEGEKLLREPAKGKCICPCSNHEFEER
jgi:hypothetical protein